MIQYVSIGAGLVSLLFFGGAMLPLVAVSDHILAISRGRAAYDKMAGQGMRLSCMLNLLAALLIGADVLAGGCAVSLMSGAWVQLLIASACAAFFTALLSLFAVFFKKGLKYLFFLIAACGGALSEAFAVILTWGILRNRSAEGFLLNSTSFDSMLPSLVGSEFIVFAVFAFFSGLAFAYAALFCWHTALRNRDDFGRDFYTTALKLRSKQALLACVCAAGAVVAVCMLCSEGMSVSIFACWLGSSPAVVGGVGSFLTVLAALLWSDVARADMPMRVKSIGFAAAAVFLIAYSLALAAI